MTDSSLHFVSFGMTLFIVYWKRRSSCGVAATTTSPLHYELKNHSEHSEESALSLRKIEFLEVPF